MHTSLAFVTKPGRPKSGFFENVILFNKADVGDEKSPCSLAIEALRAAGYAARAIEVVLDDWTEMSRNRTA